MTPPVYEYPSLGRTTAEALNWPNHLTGYESSMDGADFLCAIDIRLANP